MENTLSKIMKCSQCKSGLVKPDIVFFGENLPENFLKNVNLIE